MGASGCVNDVGMRPRKLRKASRRVSGCLERKGRGDSPRRTPDGPDDPGGEAVVPGGVHDVQERPEDVRNERVDRTNAPSRDTGLGGRLEVQQESKGTKVDRDRRKVVKGAKYDGKCPRSMEDERDIETSAPSRDRGPGAHRGKKEASGGVEGEWVCQIDGDGVETDSTGCWMDGAMSGARHDSKRVGTQLLAGDEEGQHGRRNRMMDNAPKPSKPPTEYAIPPTDHVDDSRRDLEELVQPNRENPLTKPYGRVETILGESDRYIAYIVHGLEMEKEDAQAANAKTRARLESIEADLALIGSRKDVSRAATCHIGQLLCTAATLSRQY